MKGIVTAVLVLVGLYASGTHLRSGYISVQPINCGLEYRITLNIFINTSFEAVDFGGGILRFGDGSTHTTPTIGESTPYSDQPNVGLIQYSINYNYAASGMYTISYQEINRNGGIVNIQNSVNTPFFLETKVLIDPAGGFCYETPLPIAPALFSSPSGETINLSYAAQGQENLLFDYELVNPSAGPALGSSDPDPELIYTLPENASINRFNGLFTWDTKFNGTYQPGEYVFSIKVRMWKKKEDGTHDYIGFTRFDTQIILTESTEHPGIAPKDELDENGRLYVPTEETQTIKVIYKAVGTPTNLDLQAYSELSTNTEAFSFNTYDSASVTPIKVGVLTLNSTATIDREEPYIITIRGTQKPGPFTSDLNFMLYTRDIYPEPIVTGLADETAFEIFPNPTSDWLSVKTPPDSYSKIYLSNLNGERVGTWENSNKLNLTELPPGLYILKIETPQKRGVLKVIKR